METSEIKPLRAVPLQRLVGRLVHAGQLKDTHGDTVHGVLIDCGKAVLQGAKLPLYQDVQVMHFRSTPEEIMEYLDAGIPVKTLREVYERLRVELEPTRIHSPKRLAMPALPALDSAAPRNCRRAGIGMSVLLAIFRITRKHRTTQKHGHNESLRDGRI